MALGSITSWQIDGETMETVRDFIFSGSKITTDGDCSHEIKTLAAWKKNCDQPRQHIKKQRHYFANDQPRQHIKKQRHYFANKGLSSQAMVFPVVMYACEIWTVNKAEHQRIDALEMWCWRRLLRVPLTARRSNWSILKEVSPKYSLEGLMLKLKLQYFGDLMQRTDSFEKTLMLGKIEGGRQGQQRKRWLDGITDSMDLSLSPLNFGSW